MFKTENKKLPKPEYFKWLSEYEIDLLKEMILSLEISLKGERERLKTDMNEANPDDYDTDYDYHSHMDGFNDWIIQTIEVEEIAKKLTVVGLYMIVESFTKKIMNRVYDEIDEESKEQNLRELHRWKKLKRELMRLCRLNLSEVSKHSLINELRCLNNVIKHSGYVDEELGEFPNWQNDLGQEIKVGKIDIEKFYSAIPVYLSDLVERIRSRIY